MTALLVPMHMGAEHWYDWMLSLSIAFFPFLAVGGVAIYLRIKEASEDSEELDAAVDAPGSESVESPED